MSSGHNPESGSYRAGSRSGGSAIYGNGSGGSPAFCGSDVSEDYRGSQVGISFTFVTFRNGLRMNVDDITGKTLSSI